MSGFSAIDLTKLPAPDIVETLDYEHILADMKRKLQVLDPHFSAWVASDPVIKVLEVAAYRELLLRARINDTCKALMLASATGADLDHLAAYMGVKRQLIDPGDAQAIPPVPPTYEDDERLRQRTQLSLEGHSTAGPIGSYVFHALAASAEVKDVDVASPRPGEVVVTLLSTEDQGVPSKALIQAVNAQLNREDVRPLTDLVRVQAADIHRYKIKADLMLYEGPDGEVVRQQSLQAIQAFTERHHLLGHDISLSGIYAALHQAGVQRVILHHPKQDLPLKPHQAAWCQSIQLQIGGRDE